MHGVDATLDRVFLKGRSRFPQKKPTHQHQQSTNLIWDTKTMKKQHFCANQICRQICKKIDRSTDSFGFLGDRFEICRHVDKFQICQSVNSSKNQQINRSTINKFGFLGHPTRKFFSAYRQCLTTLFHKTS